MKAGIDGHIHNYWYIHTKDDSLVIVRSAEMGQSVVFWRDIDHRVAGPVGAEFLPLPYHTYLARGTRESDFQLCIGAHLIGVIPKEDPCHAGGLEMHGNQTRSIDFLASVDWELDPRLMASP